MSAASPLVTIVTPSFNQAEFIRATIESVLSQNYPNLEYLVFDGGSTDGTVAILREYSSRLRFVSEKDRGQSHAINKGFQQAKGEVVAWLNSDDLFLPGAIAKGAAALAQHARVGAIYGDGYQIDRAGNRIQKFPFTGPFNLWRLTFLADYILQQTVFFRRSCVESVGWVDESLHYGMDWDLLVRLGKRYGLAYVPEELGCLREYGEAKSFAGGVKRFSELAALLQRQTGQVRAPGWWFYGLDTYDKVYAEKVKRLTPGPLRPVGEALAKRWVQLCRARLDHVYLHSQGLYTDGWAGPNLHWMVPQTDGRLLLEGRVESVTPNQRLAVWLAGAAEPLVRLQLPPGPFAVDVALPDHADALVLRVAAAQSFQPGPADRRTLSWRVDQIHSR